MTRSTRGAAQRATPKPGDRAYLKRLLSERNQYPDRVEKIDREINRSFGRRVAPMVLDMCGFSQLTVERGIIHYLSMIYQMHAAARPSVVENGGVVIKQEADNLYCMFDTPSAALEAGLDIFRAFEAVNSVVPPDRDIRGSIGIGFGETLIIGNRDMFGAEMNLACKLGEDVATTKEILLTEAAYSALPKKTYVCEPVSVTISGMELKAFRFVKKA